MNLFSSLSVLRLSLPSWVSFKVEQEVCNQQFGLTYCGSFRVCFLVRFPLLDTWPSQRSDKKLTWPFWCYTNQQFPHMMMFGVWTCVWLCQHSWRWLNKQFCTGLNYPCWKFVFSLLHKLLGGKWKWVFELVVKTVCLCDTHSRHKANVYAKSIRKVLNKQASVQSYQHKENYPVEFVSLKVCFFLAFFKTGFL